MPDRREEEAREQVAQEREMEAREREQKRDTGGGRPTSAGES